MKCIHNSLVCLVITITLDLLLYWLKAMKWINKSTIHSPRRSASGERTAAAWFEQLQRAIIHDPTNRLTDHRKQYKPSRLTPVSAAAAAARNGRFAFRSKCLQVSMTPFQVILYEKGTSMLDNYTRKTVTQWRHIVRPSACPLTFWAKNRHISYSCPCNVQTILVCLRIFLLELRARIDGPAVVMQRYIAQTIYRVDIGHIVSYRYRQEKYRNFDISVSFRYRFNIGETTSMLSSYFLFCR